MSFTLEVISELLEAETSKTCCRKAMLFGLFCSATLSEDKKNQLSAEFKSEEAALFAARILQKQFAAQAEPIPTVRAGRRLYRIDVTSKALHSFVSALDRDSAQTVSELVGYRCGECAHSFIRGAFIASGTINDPQKSYHLEFSMPSAARAQKLTAMLDDIVPSPKTTLRAQKVGVYYKSNESIFDLLNYMGAGQSRFLLTNTFIERDIRNSENRATNCVASNISKSVDAAMKQIEAIRILTDSGKLLSLPEELRYTAELRVENPSASLFELSHLHEPPISKSGLNRRLTKLLEEAEAVIAENKNAV